MKSIAVVMLATALVLAACPAWAEDCGQGKELYQQAVQSHDVSQTISLLRRSVAVCRNFNAYCLLGRAYLSAGRFQEADRAAREAFDLASGNIALAKVLALRGQISEGQGNSAEAVVFLRRSYQTHPFPGVLAKLKELELRAVDQGETRASITRALKSSALRAFGVEPSINLRIHFEYDRADLTPQGRSLAVELGNALASQEFKGNSFILVGHTDSRGGEAYNQRLSERRAATVEHFIIARHPSLAGRVRMQGRGKRELLYPGNSEDEHRLNRRVEVKLTSP